MFVLDTNVISELCKRPPHPVVGAWAGGLSTSVIAVTSVSVMEVRYGLSRMPAGKKRSDAERLFAEFRSSPRLEYLNFDVPAAEETAAYLVRRERIGRPLHDTADAMIAGIVLRLNNRDGRVATLATRNVGDFLNVPCVDPWRP